MTIIWLHTIAALLAMALGLHNIIFEKGTRRHRILGGFWLVSMTVVALLSFFIKEINHGDFSWIHLLTIWTICCMIVSMFSIKKGNIKTHAIFMTGTMVGLFVAGGFALVPGRFISTFIGY